MIVFLLSLLVCNSIELKWAGHVLFFLWPPVITKSAIWMDVHSSDVGNGDDTYNIMCLSVDATLIFKQRT